LVVVVEVTPENKGWLVRNKVAGGRGYDAYLA